MSMHDAPPMRADIARQPAVLEALIARAASFAAAGRALAPGTGGRIWVTGCGDGIFAAVAAAGFARAYGLDWRPIGALELALSADIVAPVDRVIAISMSGNVDRTVEAARAGAARAPLLALVNGAGGKLGEIATARVSLDLPDIAPFLCGTASYTATTAALMMLAAGAARAESALARLRSVPAVQASALSTSLPALDGRLPGGVRMLSAGADLGTAQYGAAKLVELTRIPAWWCDLEEFAHSQYWAMPTSDLVVVIAVGERIARYASESCEALGKLSVATVALDMAAAPVASATHRVTLPPIDADLAPLATAVPLQLLAYALATTSGLDPNTRLHLKNDETRFRVSRLLTRRSLVGTGH